MNKVLLIGNVGRDPEIRSAASGSRIANLSLATTERWRDKHSGERKEKTEWHRVVCFNEHLVKVIEDYVAKGSRIFIQGQMQTRKWVDHSGVEKYSTEVVMTQFGGELELLDSKPDRGGGRSDDRADGGGRDDYPPRTVSTAADLDDEIPF